MLFVWRDKQKINAQSGNGNPSATRSSSFLLEVIRLTFVANFCRPASVWGFRSNRFCRIPVECPSAIPVFY
jgi:hypothetical protein